MRTCAVNPAGCPEHGDRFVIIFGTCWGACPRSAGAAPHPSRYSGPLRAPATRTLRYGPPERGNVQLRSRWTLTFTRVTR